MEKYRDGQREFVCRFGERDGEPRKELWYCMRKSGVAEKYVRLVQDMYERRRTVVSCALGQTEEFKVEVGLHQGSALSPFLFALVMDQLSEEVREELMFADDIVICSESRDQVEENLERWRFALERRGMTVSRSKTEYMCVNEKEGSGTVRLQGEDVKKVQKFKYLGSTDQSNGECGKEVRKRVQAGEQMAPSCTMGRRQAARGSVMLWAMFCWESLGSAIHVDVILTCATCLNILADHVHCFGEPVFRDSCGLFQQDNAQFHKAKMVQEWFNEHNNEFEPIYTRVTGDASGVIGHQGRIHPGRSANPSQGTHTLSFTHAITLYGQFRNANQPTMHVFGPGEETGVPGGNPRGTGRTCKLHTHGGGGNRTPNPAGVRQTCKRANH
ncbi:hypothetical protein QTP86_022085 [Hemibagrus guttatus]|nr:hypothetical protein QTP86_022085 [Hemibagrus guttatus]